MTNVSKAQHNRQTSLGFLLNLIKRRIDAKMKTRLAVIGVDFRTFANLRILDGNEGIKQKELGRILEFPEYYTSRNIDGLVEAGFVERRPDPDSRRSVKIFLTDMGRKKVEQLPKIVSSVNSEFLTPLSKEERNTLILLLRKVAGIPEGGDPGL